LARIVGLLFAASLYFHSPALPYVICDAISIVVAMLAALRMSRNKPKDAGGLKERAANWLFHPRILTTRRLAVNERLF